MQDSNLQVAPSQLCFYIMEASPQKKLKRESSHHISHHGREKESRNIIDSKVPIRGVDMLVPRRVFMKRHHVKTPGSVQVVFQTACPVGWGIPLKDRIILTVQFFVWVVGLSGCTLSINIINHKSLTYHIISVFLVFTGHQLSRAQPQMIKQQIKLKIFSDSKLSLDSHLIRANQTFSICWYQIKVTVQGGPLLYHLKMGLFHPSYPLIFSHL